MTIIKGNRNKNGEQRRYFNCTGKSHQKTCTGPNCSIYAEDLENVVNNCIFTKLSDIKQFKINNKQNAAAINDLKLKIKAVEKTESQLTDTLLSGECSGHLLELANQKAAQLKSEKTALYEQIQRLKTDDNTSAIAEEPKKLWINAGYEKKKAAAMILIDRIIIDEDGDAHIIWNI